MNSNKELLEIKDVIACSYKSLEWLRKHFREFGYFEHVYYDLAKVDPDKSQADGWKPNRQYALKNGRGLWCQAEGTLAFLETLLTIRKCDPVLRRLGIDTDTEKEILGWTWNTFLPDVFAFFRDGVDNAAKEKSHHGLLPNIPEFGSNSDYVDEKNPIAFAVDGTARVLLALCSIREFYTLEQSRGSAIPPTDTPFYPPPRMAEIGDLIKRTADGIVRNQYTRENVASRGLSERDQGGWRRNILDTQPCLMDTTCFAILGLSAADPCEYRAQIDAGCKWIEAKKTEFAGQEGIGQPVQPGDAEQLRPVGWSYCPGKKNSTIDATSSAFALLALSETRPTNDALMRQGIRGIMHQLMRDDPKLRLFDEVVSYEEKEEEGEFSVNPTLHRTLAALLKSNAVCDSNHYPNSPGKFVEALAREVVNRKSETEGWILKLDEDSKEKLQGYRTDRSKIPSKLGDKFTQVSHVWYTYTAVHALSLYVLYECSLGNLPGWMPSHSAARIIGYELAYLQSSFDLDVQKAANEKLIADQRAVLNRVDDQLALIGGHLESLAAEKRKATENRLHLAEFGLKWSKLVFRGLLAVDYALAAYAGVLRFTPWPLPQLPPLLMGIGVISFFSLGAYAIVHHYVLAHEYPKLPKPPRVLVVLAFLCIAFVYLVEFWDKAPNHKESVSQTSNPNAAKGIQDSPKLSPIK